MNFLTIVLFPEGIIHGFKDEYGFEYSNIFFLGYDNHHMPFYALGIALSAILYFTYNKKLSFYLVLTFILASSIIRWSATTLVFVIVSYAFIFLRKFSIFSNIKPIFYVVIVLLFFFLIIVFRMQYIFKFVIVDILHKDISMSGRTSLWDMGLYYMSNNHYVLGYGIETQTQLMYRYYGVSSPHCFILNMACEGGIVSVILFFVIYILSNHKKVKRRRKTQTSLDVCTAIIGISMLVLLVESFSLNFIYILIVINYYLGSHYIKKV